MGLHSLFERDRVDSIKKLVDSLPRRRSFGDPIETFRVRYYSRLFESGFNTAVELIKQMHSEIDDLPELVRDLKSPRSLDDDDNAVRDDLTSDLGIKDIDIKNPSTIAAIIFLVVLSIHSVITGMAVGGNDSDRMEQW